MNTRTVAAVAALALAVVAVVAVVLVRPEPGPGPGDDPAERDLVAEARETMREIYAEGDPALVFDRVEPATLPREPQAHEQLEEGLEILFTRQEFEVAEEELLTIRGFQIARIRVGQVNWCVGQDGRIFLGCRVALASVAGTTDLPGVELASAELDVLATRIDVAAVLEPEGESEIVLPGPPELDSEFVQRARLVEVDYVMDQHRLRAPIDDFTLRPGVGLLFLFEIFEVTDIGQVHEAVFRFVWPDGMVEVTVDEIVWLVG